MAQTTNAGSSEDAVLELCITGTAWIDLSGWAVSATFDSWDRATGQINTLAGDEAIAGFGKLSLTGMTVNAVYSDGDSSYDGIDRIHTQFIVAGGGQAKLRYCPQGTGSTALCVTTNADAKVDSLTWPDFDAGDATPLGFSFHVKTSGFDFAAHG